MDPRRTRYRGADRRDPGTTVGVSRGEPPNHFGILPRFRARDEWDDAPPARPQNPISKTGPNPEIRVGANLSEWVGVN